jgi:hypothetical protein
MSLGVLGEEVEKHEGYDSEESKNADNPTLLRKRRNYTNIQVIEGNALPSRIIQSKKATTFTIFSR